MFYLVSVQFNPLPFRQRAGPARQKKGVRVRFVKGLITPHSFRLRDVILAGDTPSSWDFRLVSSPLSLSQSLW